MLARESHVLHATPWQNLRRICFQLDINFSVFYMMPTWCDISVCLCMWYLCVCAHWCGCSSLHVWRTDVYVKSFPLLFSFSFFFSAFWGWLPWLDMKLVISAKLTDQKVTEIHLSLCPQHWDYIQTLIHWLFCLRWVYKLKSSCLHSMYFNPYGNFPST